MPIQWYNGGILWRNGGIAFHADCCCGEVPPCTNLCGCCYSDDAVMATPAWPVTTFDEANADLAFPNEYESRVDAYGTMIDQINAAIGAKSLAFAGGGFTLDLLSATSPFSNNLDYGPLDWVWTAFSLGVTCDVVDGVHQWVFTLTARTEDSSLTFGNEYQLVGRTATGGCCGTNSAITWSFIRNIGVTPPSGADPITLGSASGTFTVSSNKCCVGELGECTHTNTENCTDYTDDAECPEEPI